MSACASHNGAMAEQDKWRAEADRLSALCDDTLKAIRYGPNMPPRTAAVVDHC